MVKSCYIVHGCISTYEPPSEYAGHFMPYIKRELIKGGYKAEIVLMPDPMHPDYSEYKKTFERYEVSEDTILVGHSCGCAFLVRWLSKSGKKLNKLILVAPWIITDENDKYRSDLFDFKINEHIKDQVKEIIYFTSNNEEEEGKMSLKIFYDHLGGKIIELKDKGHYLLEDMGTEEVPELLQEILD